MTSAAHGVARSRRNTAKRDRLPSPHDVMLDNFAGAKREYVKAHKSRHWDVFPDNFETVIANVAAWESFRRRDIAAGLGSSRLDIDGPQPARIDDAAQQKAAISAFERLEAITGEGFIREYHEATIGEPRYVEHRDLRLNIADLRLVYNCWRLSRLWDDCFDEINDRAPVIVEIGGGFGGLAAKLKRLLPRATIILFDLPEVNAMQTYYLRRAFPEAKMACFLDARKSGAANLIGDDLDFAILPGWMIETLPERSVDLAINTRSMMEMNQSVVAGYMAALNRVVRPGGIFYCVNRYLKSTVGDHIRIKDYPFDDHWFLTISEPVWDQPWIHELAAVRTTLPNAYPPRTTLAALPPRRWREVVSHLTDAVRAIAVLTWGGARNVDPGIRGKLYARRVALERKLRRWARRHPDLRRTARRLLGRGA